MSYIVFARKYRPQTFDDITGQAHITTTLKNAISQDRVAHAYIFAGPRGVGKTTAARILAKALNCAKGPTPAPCNTCPSCKETAQGSSLDVLEIDGASNRGIDEIRNLRENVKFAPSKGRYKLYIIDEVHMLTAEAFNALLKTLEEPPPHVKFIFATTDAHKVPSTILSRCQRFDFRRLATKDIARNLKEIAKNEGLGIQDEAIGLIARHADGSMRDGQVILDQIISFSKGEVAAADVTKILGVVDDEILFAFSDALIAKDPVQALKLLDGLIDGGKDTVQVLYGLIEHFRNLAVVKVSKDLGSIVHVSPEAVKRYEEDAKKLTIEEILYIITTLTATVSLVGRSKLSRIPLEAALIKLAQSHSIVSLGEIVKRIDQLEGIAKQGSSRPGQFSELPGHPGPMALEASSQGPVKTVTQGVIARRPDLSPEALAKREGPTKQSLHCEIASASPVARPRNDDVDVSVAPHNDSASANPGLMAVVQGWQQVIAHISPKKMSIASYLQEGSLESLEGNLLTMSFASEFKFHKEMLESADNKKLVEAAIKEVLGLDLRIGFRLAEYARSSGDPGAAIPHSSAGYTDDGAPVDDSLPSDSGGHRDDDPIVSSALQMFGGQIAQASKKAKGK